MWLLCYNANTSSERTNTSSCNNIEWAHTRTSKWKSVHTITSPSVSLRLAHINTQRLQSPSRPALWRFLWLMSLTYSASRQPHRQPNYPIIITALSGGAKHTHKAHINTFTNTVAASSWWLFSAKLKVQVAGWNMIKFNSDIWPQKTSCWAEGVVFTVIPESISLYWRKGCFQADYGVCHPVPVWVTVHAFIVSTVGVLQKQWTHLFSLCLCLFLCTISMYFTG